MGYANYNDDKRICRCPICQTRQRVKATGHGMTGTIYDDGGRDERFVARLECGHLMQVELYSNGYNKPQTGVAIDIPEFEDCRI